MPLCVFRPSLNQTTNHRIPTLPTKHSNHRTKQKHPRRTTNRDGKNHHRTHYNCPSTHQKTIQNIVSLTNQTTCPTTRRLPQKHPHHQPRNHHCIHW